jgi:hypothetical protein
MESMENKCVELLCWYLQLEFPKRRVKMRGERRFKRGVIIPYNYTGEPSFAYPYSDTEEMKVLFGILKKILFKIFAFEEEDINRAIFIHFDLV